MKIILELFYIFFKLGLFTFGGGYAMIPSIKEIVVEKKKWISEDEMLEILAIAESTPGPIAINMATYIGYLKGKVLGSIAATIGVVLPSLIIIFIISLFFDAFLANEYVAIDLTENNVSGDILLNEFDKIDSIFNKDLLSNNILLVSISSVVVVSSVTGLAWLPTS